MSPLGSLAIPPLSRMLARVQSPFYLATPSVRSRVQSRVLQRSLPLGFNTLAIPKYPVVTGWSFNFCGLESPMLVFPHSLLTRNVGSQRLRSTSQPRYHVCRCRSKRSEHWVSALESLQSCMLTHSRIIEFPNMAEAEDAISRLSGLEIRGVPVKLDFAPVRLLRFCVTKQS